MGIPIYLYEELAGAQRGCAPERERECVRSYRWCSEESRRRLGTLWNSRHPPERLSAHGGPRLEEGMTYRWKFDLQRRVESRFGSFAELKSVRSKDSSRWIFYSEDASRVVIYYCFASFDFVELVDLQEYVQGSTITSADSLDDWLLLGLSNGKVKIITFDESGRVRECNSVDFHAGSILDLHGRMLPHYVVACGAGEGVLVADMMGSGPPVTSKLLGWVDDLDADCGIMMVLSFPSVVLFNETRIWYCEDVVCVGEARLQEVDFLLRPEERLQNAKTCVDHSLLLETDRRYLSISTTRHSASLDNTCTIFHKTDLVSPQCYQVSCDGQHVFVSEQHLYGTSLTMYERSSQDNDDDVWISLGYSDIRAKYNINKVLRITVLINNNNNNNNQRYLSILAGDGSIQSFSIEC